MELHRTGRARSQKRPNVFVARRLDLRDFIDGKHRSGSSITVVFIAFVSALGALLGILMFIAQRYIRNKVTQHKHNKAFQLHQWSRMFETMNQPRASVKTSAAGGSQHDASSVDKQVEEDVHRNVQPDEEDDTALADYGGVGQPPLSYHMARRLAERSFDADRTRLVALANQHKADHEASIIPLIDALDEVHQFCASNPPSLLKMETSDTNKRAIAQQRVNACYSAIERLHRDMAEEGTPLPDKHDASGIVSFIKSAKSSIAKRDEALLQRYMDRV